MMVLLPGEPSTASSSPLCLNTIVGDIELRPLAGLDTVGDRPPGVVAGAEGEIGELVVEQETAHQLEAAESRLDGGGHRHRIATSVDDRDMAGRWQWLAVVDAAGEARAGRQTGFGVPIERAMSIVAARRAR